ncbi:tumor necrosis factor receptor type 1-associated DEATH domain protein-like isoform X2 [Xyrauchen texanus]|uniref:tumor necrosis factor receptor type 1-associated DEATH domain protein-like isoform X2 n=1 Tax=Xyrauchen texanus TaxID=154827 RepID=UPI002241EA3E|nr:tumor necrosis factor receptor type 1-associated DEATH domain protein-like isoform X2 [Xyrauchen texanus]
MDSVDTKRLNETNSSDGAWSGCFVLFLGCNSPAHNLLSVYKDEQGKFSVFKVIKLTLTELKFMAMPPCLRFLESYACGSLAQFLSHHASRILAIPDEVVMITQLKAGMHTLDQSLSDLEMCLKHIHQSQPERLRDDEVTRLEQQLQNSYGTLSQPPQELPRNCFLFQKRVFDDRPLTSADQQRFAAHVGRDWKRVGRVLQKNCRALKGPAIDNLAYEYEREGLYEQAYQLLGRFIQSEGRSAKLGCLISALEETKLTSMAEIMLGIQPRD